MAFSARTQSRKKPAITGTGAYVDCNPGFPSLLPRIQDGNLPNGKVAAVASDHRKIMMERSSGQQAVDDRKRGSAALRLRGKQPPKIGHRSVDGQNPAREAGLQVHLQPRLQTGPAPALCQTGQA